jgi:SAM-dependent methyltransferase
MPERDRYEIPELWSSGHLETHETELGRIRETATLLPEDTISLLDVGCGTGVFLRHLESEGRVGRLAGLERASAARSRRVCASPVHAGSAENLPFADRAFDAVAALEVIEHLPDGVYERALAEIARVASRTVVLSVPDREARRMAKCPACGGRFDPNYHQREYDSDDDLADLLPGFTLEKTIRMGIRVFPSPLGIRWIRRRMRAPWTADLLCPHCGYHDAAPGASPTQEDRRQGFLERTLPRFWNRPKWVAGLYRRG